VTASIQNTASAIKMLQKALDALDKTPEPLPGRFWQTFLFPYLDSVQKCFVSLAAQIRFYESAKSTGRALLVENEDGSHQLIDGRLVHALAVPQTNTPEPVVIYGKPDALRAVAAALQSHGWPSNGPAPLKELAQELAEAALKDWKDPDRCPMQPPA
jgi:hypothetical protein